MEQILLNNQRGKRSTNKSNMLNVFLSNKSKILPHTSSVGDVNSYDVYLNERKSNNYTLLFNINVVASNVLFNNITEITYNDTLLNYKNQTLSNLHIDGESSNVLANKNNLTNINDYVRDTQYSNFDEIKYMCGLNIFNNHLLRSETFKCVNKISSGNNDFNTIRDYMRDEYGNSIYGSTDISSRIPLHLYMSDDIMDINTAISENLIEDNGWFGFNNSNKLDTIHDEKRLFTINKVMNNEEACDFISLYPDNKLFSFSPIYNNKHKRYEKNWNYQLTYPSHSTYDCNLITQNNHSLIIKYDGTNKTYNGVESAVFHSYTKHNLLVNDTINLYVNDSLFLSNIKINSIGNDENKYTEYIFNILLEEVEDALDTLSNGIISFKKVIGKSECDYYMRMFSIIPNFKFQKEKIDDTNILNNIKEYQNYDFSNSISDMGFSKNIYNDTIAQLVYLDKINLDYLTDNLGRPLSEIYLTLIKNNKGFREWYGKDGFNISNLNVNDTNIEYSHCFGKITSGFDLFNDGNDTNIVNFPYVLNMHNIDVNSSNNKILKTSSTPFGIDDFNEISDRGLSKFNTTKKDYDYYQHDIYGYTFPGDIVEFNYTSYAETVLSEIKFRFNTAQREINSNDTSFQYFKGTVYDELISDDYDASGFNISAVTYDGDSISNQTLYVCQRPEGYVYDAHYKLQLNTFGDIKYDYYELIDNISDVEKKTDYIYEISTKKNYYPSIGCKIYAFDKKNNKNVIYGQVTKIISVYNFEITFNEKINNLSDFNLRKENYSIPSYAKLVNDGSGRFIWREIVVNGFGEEDEVYPFTNDSKYIEKTVNLYLRRQDIDMNTVNTVIKNNTIFSNPSSNKIIETELNNYVSALNIKC